MSEINIESTNNEYDNYNNNMQIENNQISQFECPDIPKTQDNYNPNLNDTLNKNYITNNIYLNINDPFNSSEMKNKNFNINGNYKKIYYYDNDNNDFYDKILTSKSNLSLIQPIQDELDHFNDNINPNKNHDIFFKKEKSKPKKSINKNNPKKNNDNKEKENNKLRNKNNNKTSENKPKDNKEKKLRNNKFENNKDKKPGNKRNLSQGNPGDGGNDNEMNEIKNDGNQRRTISVGNGKIEITIYQYFQGNKIVKKYQL